MMDVSARRRHQPGGDMPFFTPKISRRQHDHGLVDELIQTSRDNLEVFIVRDGRHRHVGSASSREIAERLLQSEHPTHQCSRLCGGWVWVDPLNAAGISRPNANVGRTLAEDDRSASHRDPGASEPA
jgi:hypothetical protein